MIRRMTFLGSLAVASLLRVLGVLAAATTPASGGPSRPGSPVPAVETHGSIRALTDKRDVAAKITLRDVQKTLDTFGLGSLSDLRGEITILESVAWLAYPPESGGAPRVVSSLESNETAGFLAVSHVPPGAWHAVGVETPLTSDNLQATIEGLLPPARKKKGAPPFVFRVDGHFQNVTLAIVDGRQLPPDAKGEAAIEKTNALQALRDVEGTLVGFYAPKDGAAFNHAHKRLHVHVVIPKNKATGHAQSFVLAPGSSVQFP